MTQKTKKHMGEAIALAHVTHHPCKKVSHSAWVAK